MERLILIDGSGLIYRGFYGIPPFFRSPTGVQTNAVYGFTSILLTMLAQYKPTHLAVAFDKKGPTFRHVEYTEYKATRTKAPNELYAQIPLVHEVVDTIGIPGLGADGFEADDVIATIVKKLHGQADLEIYIATGDFDLFQIARDGAAILYPSKGFKEASIFTPKDIEAKYGIRPDQIPDYKGIAGDSSDNIPGVKGIGDKGATELLKKYETLDGIYEHLNEIRPVLKDKLITNKETAYMSRRIATLRDDVPLDFSLGSCHLHTFDLHKTKELFGRLGFKSLERRLTEVIPEIPDQGTLF